MLLDYYPATRAFTLRVGRSECDIQELMKLHGLDFSDPASGSSEAVLFTREPYAAAYFADCATPRAYSELVPIVDAVAKSWAKTSSISVACPPDQALWDFQRADVAYALERRNSLIGDQPGLGKTPVAICFANEIRARRVLVVCPANIRLQWATRIREWTTLKWPYTVYPILRGGHGVHPNAHWMIVSYDLARDPAIGAALARLHYDLLILDEGHYLKTIDSQRTRAIFGGGLERQFDAIASRADRILSLTGTPLPNRPREAYTLARGLCFDSIDFMSEDAFRTRFNPSYRGEIVDEQTGRTKFYIDERSGRHAELQNRLRANFMVRHLKRDVLDQLKVPQFDIVEMADTSAVRKVLHAESMLHIDPDTLEGLDFIDDHVATVRRMMGVALAPQIAEYTANLLDSGEDKIVLFAWHIEVLGILQKALEDYGVLRIDGSTSATRKQNIVDAFIRDPERRVLIGNMLSLGTGTDGLQQVCTRGIIAEPDWVFGNNQQCADRLDRALQTGQVMIDLICAGGSILSHILNRALNKGQTTHLALDARRGV